MADRKREEALREERREANRRDEERRSEERRSATDEVTGPKIQIRWGKVVREVEDEGRIEEGAHPEEPDQPPPETPGRRIAQDRRRSRRHRRTRLKAAIVVLSALSAVLLLEVIMNMERGALLVPPVSILGIWVTDDPRYEGRGFDLSNDNVVLHLGEGLTSSHEIRSIRRLQVGDSWDYEITYASPDGDQTLDFFVHPGGILRLKNPPDVIWRRPDT